MPRQRYSTYLWPKTANRQPSRMGALAVLFSAQSDGPGSTRRHLRLTQWALELWSARNGISRRPDVLTGNTARSFWEVLGRLLYRPGRIVCLVPRLIRTVALLNLWALVDAGKVLLHTRPLLIDDPPSALSVGLPGLPGRLVLLDTRNYAIEVPDDHTALFHTGAFLRTMVSTLAAGGMGSLQPTVAAQALVAFRRYPGAGLVQIHCRGSVLALERRSIHGGRSECLRLGKVLGPVHSLDVTAFYATLMRDTPVPVRLRHWGWGSPPWRSDLFDGGASMIARVLVETDRPYYPHFRNGITIYPVGRFWTDLAGPELACAYVEDRIQSWGQWATYDLEPALADFAADCLGLRSLAKEKGDRLLSDWAKALPNRLLGKFAAECRAWVVQEQVEPPLRWGRWYYTNRKGERRIARALAGKAQIQVKGGFARLSAPMVTAWIWSAGRVALLRLMEQAGPAHVLYCNTDGLIVDQVGLDNLSALGLVRDGEPGFLRLEDSNPEIEILGINHYRTRARTVCAGIVGSGEADSPSGPAGFYPETVAQAIARKHAPEAVEFASPPEYRGCYRHGICHADGSVEPWWVWE